MAWRIIGWVVVFAAVTTAFLWWCACVVARMADDTIVDTERERRMKSTTRKAVRSNGDNLHCLRWTCLLCGRDKFSRPGQPHKCTGGFRKRFKAEAARRGIDNAWVQTPITSA